LTCPAILSLVWNASRLEDIARRHLPPEMAEQWISLLRPGIRLSHAGEGDPVVGHLGGDPPLSPDEPWPEVDGRPLNHLLTLELAVLPRIDLDLPERGRLSFYCEGSSGESGLVRYQSEETTPPPRPTPAEISSHALTHVDVTAALFATAPDGGHSYLNHLVEDEPAEGTPEYEAYLEREEPIEAYGFRDEVASAEIPTHLIGGYGMDVQYTADYAPVSTPMTVPGPEGPIVDTELPVMLAQIDTDHAAGIGWGDMGTSLWVIDRADLAARRFDAVRFHWNCH
jgi:hypothetical protein